MSALACIFYTGISKFVAIAASYGLPKNPRHLFPTFGNNKDNYFETGMMFSSFDSNQFDVQ